MIREVVEGLLSGTSGHTLGDTLNLIERIQGHREVEARHCRAKWFYSPAGDVVARLQLLGDGLVVAFLPVLKNLEYALAQVPDRPPLHVGLPRPHPRGCSFQLAPEISPFWF